MQKEYTNAETVLQTQGRGAARSSDLFGSFKAELWGDDEYVITCKAGAIGHTVDKRTAQWLPSWLNSAMAEAMTKLPNAGPHDIKMKPQLNAPKNL